jgi:hypothetical protein
MWKNNRFCENRHNGSGEKKEKAETYKNKKSKKECASPESNRGLNDGNVEFYH